MNVIRKLTERYLTTGANNGYGLSTNYDAYLSNTISFSGGAGGAYFDIGIFDENGPAEFD